MASWKEKLPDYEIVRWDESNFMLSEHPYAGQAYEAGKWAFVSDYVRVWVLLNYGGVYLDTDYEIVGSLEPYLGYGAFLGFENKDYVGTAIMGAVKGHWLLREMLCYYDTHPFSLGGGRFDMIPNTMVITDVLEGRGYKRGKSSLIGDVFIGEQRLFYASCAVRDSLSNSESAPTPLAKGKDVLTCNKLEDSLPHDGQESPVMGGFSPVGIHYFRGSWWSEKERRRAGSKVYGRVFHPMLVGGKKLLRVIVGPDLSRRVERMVKNIMK